MSSSKKKKKTIDVISCQKLNFKNRKKKKTLDVIFMNSIEMPTLSFSESFSTLIRSYRTYTLHYKINTCCCLFSIRSIIFDYGIVIIIYHIHNNSIEKYYVHTLFQYLNIIILSCSHHHSSNV